MLLPLGRTFGTVLQSTTCPISTLGTPLYPGVKHLLMNQMRTFSRASAPSSASTRLIGLIAMAGTERLAGPTILNAVHCRHVSTELRKSSEPALQPASMQGLHGTLIRSMQPQFLKIGFSKIQENEYSITFSDTMLKVELAVTDRHFHPELTIHLIKGNGEHHCLTVLREALSSPEIKEKEMQARHSLMEKYGMWKTDTPASVSTAGDRACLLLSLKHSIQFLGAHKKTLSLSSHDY